MKYYPWDKKIVTWQLFTMLC